jgi:hypothetical protein
MRGFRIRRLWFRGIRIFFEEAWKLSVFWRSFAFVVPWSFYLGDEGQVTDREKNCRPLRVRPGLSRQGSCLRGFWGLEGTWALMTSDQGFDQSLILGGSSLPLQHCERQIFKRFWPEIKVWISWSKWNYPAQNLSKSYCCSPICWPCLAPVSPFSIVLGFKFNRSRMRSQSYFLEWFPRFRFGESCTTVNRTNSDIDWKNSSITLGNPRWLCQNWRPISWQSRRKYHFLIGSPLLSLACLHFWK